MSQTDQASHLRRLMQQSGRTRTIAIASGKGGVGKSNIALNLAIMLSASGQRVARWTRTWAWPTSMCW